MRWTGPMSRRRRGVGVIKEESPQLWRTVTEGKVSKPW